MAKSRSVLSRSEVGLKSVWGIQKETFSENAFRIGLYIFNQYLWLLQCVKNKQFRVCTYLQTNRVFIGEVVLKETDDLPSDNTNTGKKEEQPEELGDRFRWTMDVG